jgi:hypothetical protein
LAELEEEREAVRAMATAETREPLLALLSGRFPDLVELLEGARAAFASRGPDYVRHFTTSLRELFTHVLHRLAPDEGMRAWTTAPEDFHQGRPTRAARLRYACQAIDDDRFKDFVKKDVAAVVSFLGLFQGGTHEVTSSYTAAQLRALMARMEGVLHLLLVVSGSE